MLVWLDFEAFNILQERLTALQGIFSDHKKIMYKYDFGDFRRHKIFTQYLLGDKKASTELRALHLGGGACKSICPDKRSYSANVSSMINPFLPTSRISYCLWRFLYMLFLDASSLQFPWCLTCQYPESPCQCFLSLHLINFLLQNSATA